MPECADLFRLAGALNQTAKPEVPMFNRNKFNSKFPLYLPPFDRRLHIVYLVPGDQHDAPAVCRTRMPGGRSSQSGPLSVMPVHGMGGD